MSELGKMFQANDRGARDIYGYLPEESPWDWKRQKQQYQWSAPQIQGWQCPFCKVVYSPSVEACRCQASMEVRLGLTNVVSSAPPPQSATLTSSTDPATDP